MAVVLPAVFISLLVLKVSLPTLCLAANHEPKHDVVNAFEALAALSRAVAMADTDDSGDLDCMMAVRKDFSDDPPRFVYDTYMKSRNSDKKITITYHIKPGPTNDTTEFTINDDYDNVMQAHFLYSDYKDCIIMKLPIYGNQVCVLWTDKIAAGAVPVLCTEQFQDTCGNAVTSYDEETCGPLGL